MTTGQKIAKFRKEHKLTQEELADLLQVTRQSVSKWESDLSFPETEKLIQLAKIFDCSLDYLLLTDFKEKPSDAKVGNPFLVFYQNKTFYTTTYSIIYFLVMLILYFFKIVSLPVETIPFVGETYFNPNAYQLLTSIGSLGNNLVLFALFSAIATVVTGVLISFTTNKKILYILRKIFASAELIFWLWFAVFFISHSQIGFWFIFIAALINTILLFSYRKNKYSYLTENKS